MREDLEPIVGKWYLDVERDETFRVVAIDEESEVIEIRYVDGEEGEIELDNWEDMDLDVAEPPEDESAEDEDDDPPAAGWRERTEPSPRETEDWDEDEDEDDDEDDDDDDDDDWDDDEDDDRRDTE